MCVTESCGRSVVLDVKVSLASNRQYAWHAQLRSVE